MRKTKRTFLDIFKTDRPALKVKFNINSDEPAIDVLIENKLAKTSNSNALVNLERLCSDKILKDFLDFCSQYDGFALGIPKTPKNSISKPLLRQLSVVDFAKFTELYLPNGKWAWTIDLNKTKAMYRSSQNWLAFAEIDGGPRCLTIFLEGQNAGNIFLLEPQPHFNILKPIAKTYTQLLERIAKGPSAFYKMTRAYVTIVGKDKQNYGYVPIEYIDNLEV